MFYSDVSHKPPSTAGSRKRRPRKKWASDSVSSGVWKKDTVCLRLKSRRKGPDMQEKMNLAKAGLGLRELIFSNDGDALHVHHVIVHGGLSSNS